MTKDEKRERVRTVREGMYAKYNYNIDMMSS